MIPELVAPSTGLQLDLQVPFLGVACKLNNETFRESQHTFCALTLKDKSQN